MKKKKMPVLFLKVDALDNGRVRATSVRGSYGSLLVIQRILGSTAFRTHNPANSLGSSRTRQ